MHKKNPRALLVFLFVVLLPLKAFSHHIKIEASELMKPLPGKTTSSAYFSVKNTGGYDVNLISVSADFAVVEMHETVTVDGRSRMIRHESISVPAGSRVDFERGGKHLMLFRVKNIASEQVKLRFSFDDGTEFTRAFNVKQW